MGNVWKILSQLLRFVFWYAIVIVIAFHVLPLAGLMIQDRYESMSSAARILAILGFFGVIAVWHVLDRRRLLNRPDPDSADSYRI